ncbi:MAG: hypothetical protein AUH85_05105 [Chloroflexi bacterium 13_1_40CM_4_68_4]|nr:MAG: hypothetical protein AUH85_05105 [Chloroflexi bacterium 13_1_40CM_4_68_4]
MASSGQRRRATPTCEGRWESGLIGSATKSDADLRGTLEKIERAAVGIRIRDYTPKPSVANCGTCAFAEICPSAMR